MTLLPREIVLRHQIDWEKNCCNAGAPLKFGKYVEAHEDPDTTNTMKLQIFPVIYLGPTGNLQGTKKVFNLKKGVTKKPRNVTSYPMPENVIKLVDAWGIRYQK